MKKFVVIAYDIEDDKRRRGIAKLLEAIGARVNKSVFECFLTDNKLEKLKAKITKQMTADDSVLYYVLCKSCIERIERRGAKGMPVETVRIV